jgi:hypothetical protein
MPLQLDERGVLPDGIHDATLEEIESLFGGFQHSDRRHRLFLKLKQYVGALRSAGFACSLLIDGSFVMGCIDEPDDIDLVLVLSSDWDMHADLQPFRYNLVSRKDLRREYPFDLYLAQEDTETGSEILALFALVNVKWYSKYGFATGATKGLVRLQV